MCSVRWQCTKCKTWTTVNSDTYHVSIHETKNRTVQCAMSKSRVPDSAQIDALVTEMRNTKNYVTSRQELARDAVRRAVNRHRKLTVAQLRKRTAEIIDDITRANTETDLDAIAFGLMTIKDKEHNVIGVSLRRLVELEIESRTPHKHKKKMREPLVVTSLVRGGLPTLGRR